jgi:hypothetical protein
VSTDESTLAWRKSTRCGTTSCIEVADLPNGRAVRDSDHPDGPSLMFEAVDWAAFMSGIRGGAFQAN